ncbi:MAG: HD domain-containing protein [Oligoflexia bacterium]|nr:HD domain-containing protein [Oligoflexia bacterium]
MKEHQSFSKILAEVHAGHLRRQADPARPGRGFFEIPVEFFVARIDVNMPALPAIAFFIHREGAFEKIRDADQPFSPLVLSLHSSIWISDEHIASLRDYASQVILATTPLPGGGFPMETRMESLRRSALLVVDDLFQDPSPQNIDKSVKVVSSFVHVLMKDPKAYLFLAKLSSHDPYTLQHSVGTSVNCIILGRKMGLHDDGELLELGLAGLLHDIGKVKVRKEIINKNGPLDEAEWEEMRQHSLHGYETVKNHPAISERTKRAILEHHEDKVGTGYPLALREEQLHPFSKIVCICDVFNALTTNRSYSTARTPFDAFQLMKDKMKHKFDDRLFRELVLVYGGHLDAEGNLRSDAPQA